MSGTLPFCARKKDHFCCNKLIVTKYLWQTRTRTHSHTHTTRKRAFLFEPKLRQSFCWQFHASTIIFLINYKLNLAYMRVQGEILSLKCNKFHFEGSSTEYCFSMVCKDVKFLFDFTTGVILRCTINPQSLHFVLSCNVVRLLDHGYCSYRCLLRLLSYTVIFWTRRSLVTMRHYGYLKFSYLYLRVFIYSVY